MRALWFALALLLPLSACIPDGEPGGLWRGGLPDMPFTATLTTGVTDSAGGLWVAGGGYASTQSMSFAHFDLETLQWETRASLTTTTGSPVLSGSVTLVGGTPYACAYLSNYNPGSRCERYDDASDAWTPIETPPIPLSIGLLVGELGGRLALVDGYTGFFALYDPVQQQWAQGPEMIGNAGARGLATMDGQLWAFNSSTSLVPRSVQVYDPAGNSWAEAALNPAEGLDLDFGAAVVGGRIWLVEKRPFVDYQNNVREPSRLLSFDTVTRAFHAGDELDEQVRNAGVFGAGGTVFIAGGVTPDTIFETPVATFQGFEP